MALRTRLFHRSSPIFLRAGSPELLVERLALAELQVGELEVRHQAAVHEERGAEPGAERDHHLEAVALTTAAPWTSASLATRHGLPIAWASADARSKSDQALTSVGVDLGARALRGHEVRRTEHVTLCGPCRGSRTDTRSALGQLGDQTR